MRFRLPIAATLACVLLSGCAYTQDQSYQDLTIETPGAANTICHVTIDKLKYVFYPPEKQTVIKHGKPMEVACLAPGNREKTILVEAGIEKSTWNNFIAGGGLLGVGWDRASNAIFTYPETVYVDFNDVPTTSMPLPHHNNPDIKQPEEYKLEEFLPSAPLMNRDKNRGSTTLQRKGAYDDVSSVNANPALGKGDLKPVTQTGGGYFAGQ